MTHYQVLHSLGFSQKYLRMMLQVSSFHQSVAYIIAAADRLFSAPLALSPEQVANMAAWPEGYLNISMLLHYQDIVLNLGIADSLDYFTTREQRIIFIEDLAEVIIEDRLLHDEDADGETTDESVSPLSFNAPSSMRVDQQKHFFEMNKPLSVVISPCEVAHQAVHKTLDEPAYKRFRPGIELLPMDAIDTREVIDSFLIIFTVHESMRYATNSLANLLRHESSRPMVYDVLNAWLVSDDLLMKDNVLKFVCALLLDVDGENAFLKNHALNYMVELIEDETTKASVMQSLHKWLHSDEDYWRVFATEMIQCLLATGPSAMPPSASGLAVASITQASPSAVNNAMRSVKRSYLDCSL